MADSALFLLAIGVMVLAVVVEGRGRSLAFQAAIFLYLGGLIDMALNVMIGGVVGWQSMFG